MVSYLAFTGIMLALGIDIALPAFDEIGPDIGLAEGSNRISVIITVYFIGMGVGQLVWGPVSDAYGRQRAMLLGMALYVVAAFAAALAPSFGWMLAARLVWGIGAAAPAGLRPAIARDLFTGNRMARIMSMVMAIFMIGPIIAPLVGELILLVAPWPGVFYFCVAAGAVQMFWTVRFGETLQPQHRRPLEFRTTAEAFRRVLSTRATVAYTLALTFSYGAFYIFLGSSQPIMDIIYGRADQFAIAFGVAGIFMAGAFVVVNAIIERFGARAVSVTGMTIFVVLAIVQLLVTRLSDGVPPFGVWLGGLILINMLAAPVGPSCFTLGLEPLGELAGTASGVMGFLAFVLGSALAAVFDAAIDTTVTPMAVAYLLYGVLTLVCLLLAEPRSAREVSR